jgi:DNA modification methylase
VTHFAEAFSITVPPNRMRKEFKQEAHEQLMGSIRTKGLLHPVVCRRMEGHALELVAGERRLRAVQGLMKASPGLRIYHNGELCPGGTIPFSYLHEVDVETLLEVELEENVVREDLSLLEKIEGRKRLFELRKKQAADRGETYNAQDFSKELTRAGVGDVGQAQVFKELSIAAVLDKPGVKEAAKGGINEMVKAAKKATESYLISALGETLGKAPPPKHQLLIGDACELITTLPANTYDCVCTDPPYGIGIDDSGSMVTHEHHYADDATVLENILDRVPNHLYRITRSQAHVYWFCDLRWFGKISAALEDAGFTCWHRPIIWGKRGKSMAPDITRWPKTTCEFIIYAIKGDRPPLKVADDLIITSYGSDLQQAEKPKELYVELLSRSVLEGAKVIDPFCGSGVIFTAAEQLKVSATGIEQEAARAELAKVRAYGI